MPETQIIPQTRFTEFPELTVDLRIGISRSASGTDDRFYFIFPVATPHAFSGPAAQLCVELSGLSLRAKMKPNRYSVRRSRQIESIIGLRCRPRNKKPESKRIMRINEVYRFSSIIH